MKYKIPFYLYMCFFIFTANAQNNKFSIAIGHNSGFVKSIERITPNGIYFFNKNNKTNDDLILIPNYNIGINYEHKLSNKYSFFLGFHSSRTETTLIFQDFNNPADYSSFVKYGYSVNTYEVPLGICYTLPLSNIMLVKNYFSVTINFNGLSQGVIRYRLFSQSTNSDTIRLNFTDIAGFPSGNSLGIRYGLGIIPFKKFSNWEIGAYINLQFKRSLTWDQEVEFENVSQNTYEYHHAILKDKPDYINFHIKYTFLNL